MLSYHIYIPIRRWYTNDTNEYFISFNTFNVSYVYFHLFQRCIPKHIDTKTANQLYIVWLFFHKPCVFFNSIYCNVSRDVTPSLYNNFYGTMNVVLISMNWGKFFCFRLSNKRLVGSSICLEKSLMIHNKFIAEMIDKFLSNKLGNYLTEVKSSDGSSRSE